MSIFFDQKSAHFLFKVGPNRCLWSPQPPVALPLLLGNHTRLRPDISPVRRSITMERPPRFPRLISFATSSPENLL